MSEINEQIIAIKNKTTNAYNKGHEISGHGTHAFQNIDRRWKIIHKHFSKT